jgi:hypothetical protein
MYCLGSLGQDRAYEIQVGDDEGGAESTASVALFRDDQALALWLTAEQLDGFIDALTRARRALPRPFTVGVTGHLPSGPGANTSS